MAEVCDIVDLPASEPLLPDDEKRVTSSPKIDAESRASRMAFARTALRFEQKVESASTE
jgi:hypothetical protein